MRGTLNVIGAIIAISYVVYSFFGNLEYQRLFGFDINIWTYRLIWTVLAVVMLYSYYIKKKTQ